jgi:hypothetical protein
MMPNGKVLLAVGPQNYNGPTTFFEYDPNFNALAQVPSPGFTGPPYEGRMLMLPSGDVLWSYGKTQLYVFTPDAGGSTAWKPTIGSVTKQGGTTYLLTGTQLNGISEGASYGDDAEMSSNYPVVRFVNDAGKIFYGRTFSWSNTGVATGSQPVSTYFTLPPGVRRGTFQLSVVANGIPSDPVTFTVGGGRADPTLATALPTGNPVLGFPTQPVREMPGAEPMARQTHGDLVATRKTAPAAASSRGQTASLRSSLPDGQNSFWFQADFLGSPL